MRVAADDEGVRHTSGGLRLVALTVLAVGCCAVPGFAKQDPGQTHPARQQMPPGQAKKQAGAPAGSAAT